MSHTKFDTLRVPVRCATHGDFVTLKSVDDLTWECPLCQRTCATCRHWCAGRHQGEEMRESYIRSGWAAECAKQGEFRRMFTVYIYGDGRVDDYDFETPPTFGCSLHHPTEQPQETNDVED